MDARLLDTTEMSIRIFETIEEWGGATMAELEAEFPLSKSSMYGHLQTLRHCGFLSKEGEQYHISLKMLWFAEHARRRKPEYELARTTADELAETTGEEVSFAVEENGRPTVLYDTLEENARPTYRPGTTAYMHNSAVGKAILVEESDEKIEEIIAQRGLPKTSENTVTTEAELRSEIRAARERGYALIDQEYTSGQGAIAKAVVGPGGRVFGAFSIPVPTYRVSVKDLQSNLAPKLVEVAEACEAELER
jgi:DNA-binding IclR family transcriptional regulator